MKRTVTRRISGWGRCPTQSCTLLRPEKYADLLPVKSCIARGRGKSYGDASLNADHTVILTERLNRFLAFDKSKGILTAEAGVTLAEILEVITPHGFFLPVTPGTKYASLGGCIAADVHGKNHHHVGSFGNHLIALELITADQTKILCTPQKHAELFWATIGGMGLTGIIGTAVLKLMPVPSPHMMVCHHAAADIDQTFLYLTDKVFDDHYSVAWLDCLSRGHKLGRSIAMTAHHAKPHEIPTPFHNKESRPKTLGFDMPTWVLNNTTTKLFNEYYFRTQAKKSYPYITSYQSYFYPLDNISDWNRLYGKKGFVQYQCVLPETNAFDSTKMLLETMIKNHCTSYLAVLKRFGEGSKGHLSFPEPGFTLALDIPYQDNKTQRLLNNLDEIVISNHGRVYLAKDAFLSPQHFRAMYPRYSEWLAIKQKIDPEHVFSSSLSKRLHIGQ